MTSNVGGEFLFTNAGNNFGIKFSEVSNIQDNASASLTVLGTVENDDFQLGTNNFVVKPATAELVSTVNYSNKKDLAFVGLDG